MVCDRLPARCLRSAFTDGRPAETRMPQGLWLRSPGLGHFYSSASLPSWAPAPAPRDIAALWSPDSGAQSVRHARSNPAPLASSVGCLGTTDHCHGLARCAPVPRAWLEGCPDGKAAHGHCTPEHPQVLLAGRHGEETALCRYTLAESVDYSGHDHSGLAGPVAV
eukprot:1862139-Rhodomonas_salina.4